MSQKLLHALHNEAASKFLTSKPEYMDWIVTTAFYSALHYIEFHVFPFKHTEGGKEHEFKSIADYKRFKNSHRTKHELRFDLVMWKCREIEAPYKWLQETCFNARYYDYSFPSPKIVLALTEANLKAIKKHCSPPPAKIIAKK